MKPIAVTVALEGRKIREVRLSITVWYPRLVRHPEVLLGTARFARRQKSGQFAFNVINDR